MSTRRFACLACLSALVMFTGVQAPAREAPPGDADTDYTAFSLDELTGMDVVYGAASYDQKISDAPASVTVITADEIRAHGYRTLADVLASVRGFAVTYDRSYDYVGVRGFGRPGDYDTRVLLLHDGHPSNDIIYGTAAVGPEMTVDLSIVKRIEVIRGPGSALYGASAFFAVINLVTFDGDELGGASVVGEAGSRGRFGGQAAWGGPVGGGGSLLVEADGFRDGGDDLYWPEYDDPATNNGVFVDGDREAAGHAYLKYTRAGLQATAGWARRDKRIPTGDWDMIFNDTGAEVSDERVALDLSGVKALPGGATLRGRLSFDDYTCRGDYPYDNAGEGEPLDRVVQHDEAHGTWWSGEVQLGTRQGSHRLVAGADFRRAASARQVSFIEDPYEALLDVDGAMDNAGIYVQDEWALGAALSATLGLRWDTYHSFGGNLTPRCGLVAHPDGRTTAKLLYGEAFRAPNAYELYYGDGLSQKQNPSLEPEFVSTWEAVVERELTDRLRLGVSAFENRLTGLIDQAVDADDGMVVFRNVDEAYTRGVECDLDARLLPGLRGRLSLSAQRGENESLEQPLTNAPARMVKLNLTTPRTGVKLAGALEVLHVSRRLTLDGDWAPAYAVVNLDATWWTPVHGLQLDVALDNALDQRYGDPGAGHQAQDVLAREGRLVQARLGWRW